MFDNYRLKNSGELIIKTQNLTHKVDHLKFIAQIASIIKLPHSGN